jgi:hypothetical protein
MRCSRCDRPAIPQAVGHTPEGLIVFGWCLHCLEETGCTEIEVAETRLNNPESSSSPDRLERSGEAERLLLQRRRGAALVAGLMGIWSVVLLTAGGWFGLRRTAGPASPFGNGMPIFFLGGGAAVGIVSLGMTFALYGEPFRRFSRIPRWVGTWSFVLALAALGTGIAVHDPRLDPVFVLVAGLCLLVSMIAIRQERRRSGVGIPPQRTRSDRSPDTRKSGHHGG